jgi:hypothetical protein
MQHPFDNIVWNALSGPHADHAAGTDEARRYAAGFSPIVGFADPEHPNVDALAPFCESGESFYCDGWSGAAPSSWHVHAEEIMLKMIFDASMPASDDAHEAVALRTEHREQVLELVALTRPGPFGPRTPELGEYFGVLRRWPPRRDGWRANARRRAARDQRRVHAPRFSRARSCTTADDEAHPARDAAG